MVGPLLSRDDLDALSDHAQDADDPAAVAAQLVQAASGRLADPADAAYAYLRAAEIYEQADDLPQALTLAERALAADRAAAHDLRQARSYRSRLLRQLGREEEATPDGLEDDYEPDLGDLDEEPYALDLDDLDEERYAPYLDLEGSADADGLLLVWSRDAYEQLDQRWPEVLEPTGADDWDGYRRYCQTLITAWARRGRSLLAVTGDADEFDEWLTDQGADPYYANLLGLVRGYGRHVADQADPVELPPRRDDPCWCGSDHAYADCCSRLVS